jgi:gamma-glutamylaminecyclotransferase
VTGLGRLFVYGTLMRGEANAHLMTAARFVGEARTVTAYQLRLLEGYPALLPGGRTAVRGELHLVDGALLAVLDEFEGHPTLFRRQEVDLAGGARAEAYLFAAPAIIDAAASLADGDWRRWRRSRTGGTGQDR